MHSFIAAIAPVEIENPDAPDETATMARSDQEPDPVVVEFVTRYYWRPDLFADECIAFDHDRNEGPTAYQREILREIGRHRRVSFRGPRGLGKTALAAWCVWWWALTRDARGVDWKIPITAGSDVQLVRYAWPEIHKWAKRIRWEIVGRAPLRAGRELLEQTIKLTYGESFKVNAENNEEIEGAHATALMFLFDESKVVPDKTFDSIEGAFANARADTGAEMLALAISTPGAPVGRFYDIHSRKAGYEEWWVRHVTLEETLAERRLDPEWAAARLRAWGADSYLYQQQVKGNFYAEESTGVIPLAWIELAQERWRVRFLDEEGNRLSPELPAFSGLGVDVAAGGGDETVFAPRYGPIIPTLERHNERDVMAVTGHAANAYRRHASSQASGADPDAPLLVDVIGVGAGVVYRLAEVGLPVIAWNASTKTEETDVTGELTFLNRRSWGWWHLRELLDPASGQNLELPPDDLLTGDLVAPTWKPTSRGVVQVEGKEEIRKRLGRSTDSGDAVVQVFSQEGTDRLIESAIIPGQSYRISASDF